MTLDPLKYYKTPLIGEAKRQFDENWEKINWEEKREKKNSD